MSRIVVTDLGRFNRVRYPGTELWMWECPSCETWQYLSDEQFNGKISVGCAMADDNSLACQYHQTHNFGVTLKAAMAARVLTQTPVFDEGEEAVRAIGGR